MMRTSGFTLIELTTAMGVLAVLLMLGMPAFAGLRQRAQVGRTYNLLTTSLAYARLTAVARNTPVSVCPSGDGQACRKDRIWEDGWIIFADPARTGQPASPAAILQRIESIGRGLALRSTVGRSQVRFHPTGWAYGSNLSVRLCSLQDRQHLGSVIVNNAGRPRSERHENSPCPYVP